MYKLGADIRPPESCPASDFLPVGPYLSRPRICQRRRVRPTDVWPASDGAAVASGPWTLPGRPSPAAPGDLLRRAAAARAGPDRVRRRRRPVDLGRARRPGRAPRPPRSIAAGLGPGDRVVLIHPTSIALRRRPPRPRCAPGWSPARSTRRSPPPELAHVVTDSGAGAVLTTGAGRRARAARGRRRARRRRTPPPRADPQLDRTGDDLVVLLYTSGTSGRPRGAMLSARALLANIAQVAAIEPAAGRARRRRPAAVAAVPRVRARGGARRRAVERRHGGAVRPLRPRRVRRGDRAARGDGGGRRAADVRRVVDPGADVGEAFAGVRLALSGAAALPAALVARVRGPRRRAATRATG